MDSSYKPFFSRKQITALLWFSLIAILVLSSMGPGKVEYQKIEHNKAKSVYWMELDNQPLTLTLLLAGQPALNENQRQVQQLKAIILRERMRGMINPTYSFSVVPRQDRIELNIQWAANHDMPDIKHILDKLQAPVQSGRWEEQLANIQARSYLENQAAQQQLFNLFFTKIQTEARPVLNQLNAAYAKQFDQLMFAISGEDAEDYADQLTELFPSNQAVNHKQATLSTTQQNLTLKGDNSNDYGLLTGGIIPARGDERFVEYRVAAQVVQDLLKEYQAQHNLQYRLLWGALNDIGYQALVLNADQNPGPLLPQLQQLVSEELVELSQQRLIEQWNDRMREHRNQAQAMSLIAFYGLDTDTLEDYADDITDIDTDRVIKLAQEALETQQHINILLTPSL